MFAADLLRALHRAGLELEVDFLSLSSYRSGTVSSGQVNIVRDVESDVDERSVVLIDDILESGRTLAFAKDLMAARGALSVTTCVLLNKPGKRATEHRGRFRRLRMPRPVRRRLRHGHGPFVSGAALSWASSSNVRDD